MVVVVVGGWLEGGRLELVTVIMVKLSRALLNIPLS